MLTARCCIFQENVRSIPDGEKKAEPEKTWKSGTDTFLRDICQDDRHLNYQKSIICLKRAYRESYGKEIPSEGAKE